MSQKRRPARNHRPAVRTHSPILGVVTSVEVPLAQQLVPNAWVTSIAPMTPAAAEATFTVEDWGEFQFDAGRLEGVNEMQLACIALVEGLAIAAFKLKDDWRAAQLRDVADGLRLVTAPAPLNRCASCGKRIGFSRAHTRSGDGKLVHYPGCL